MEIDSMLISPIKNKSNKQDKSTICDKTCLQVILNDEIKGGMTNKYSQN